MTQPDSPVIEGCGCPAGLMGGQVDYPHTRSCPRWPCPLCGQKMAGHDQAACYEKMAAWKPTGFLSEPDLAAFGYVAVPHELLVDSGGHTCDATCLALYGNAYLRVPAPLPRRTRIRHALRRARWRVARLGGLRLVHSDRVDPGSG